MQLELGSTQTTMGALGGGVIAGALGLVLLAPSVGTGDWPTAQGTITESDVDIRRTRDRDGHRKTRARVEIRFDYTVDGVPYSSDAAHVSHLGLGGFLQSTTGRWTARRTADKYPEGSSVTVFYDPSDPARGTLDTSFSLAGLVLLVVGTGAAGFGAWQGFAG